MKSSSSWGRAGIPGLLGRLGLPERACALGARHAGVLLALVALLAPALAVAQSAASWPARPIRVVVPYAAGGYYDSIARITAPRLAEALGQPVVVENRVGASGIIGTEYVAKAAPNGYTVMVGGIGPHSINPSLFATLPYDPVRDFAPVILVAVTPNVLVVHPSATWTSLSDLLGSERARSGAMNYGSAGSGTSAHLAAEMFAAAAGIRMTHIPYKGSGPAVLAMVAGETDLLFGTATDVLQQIRGGKLRALAVTSARRLAALADVPTLGEAGVANAVAAGWYGYFAPAGTPRDVIQTLNEALNRILQMPAAREQLAVQDTSEVVGGTPEQLAGFLQTEILKWREVVRRSGAKAD